MWLTTALCQSDELPVSDPDVVLLSKRAISGISRAIETLLAICLALLSLLVLSRVNDDGLGSGTMVILVVLFCCSISHFTRASTFELFVATAT